MRKYAYKIIFMLLLMSVAAVSCDTVHEFPDNEPFDPTMVNVDVDITVRISDLTGGGSFPQIKGDDHTCRMIIEAYKFDDKNVAVLRKELLVDTNLSDLAVKETMRLTASKYRIVVWMDYVPTNNPSDRYYSTTSGLRGITLIEPLVGNTDYLDCFFGGADVDLTPYRDQWNIHIEVPVEIARPVSKYILVTNDVEEFITRASGKGAGHTRSDINLFTAKITYPSHQANEFDAYSGQLIDAKQGMTYSSSLRLINDKEAILCFAYPLTNGPGSKAAVKIEIFDDSGTLINEVSELKIPITRGELTIVRSDFLTRSYAPGITIDPEYEGTIPVILPD